MSHARAGPLRVSTAAVIQDIADLRQQLLQNTFGSLVVARAVGRRMKVRTCARVCVHCIRGPTAPWRRSHLLRDDGAGAAVAPWLLSVLRQQAGVCAWMKIAAERRRLMSCCTHCGGHNAGTGRCRACPAFRACPLRCRPRLDCATAGQSRISPSVRFTYRHWRQCGVPAQHGYAGLCPRERNQACNCCQAGRGVHRVRARRSHG